MVKTNKFSNFKNALERLNEMNARYELLKTDEAVCDALIKRFEFTFDLAWKSLREFLLLQGIDSLSSPRAVFSEAYRAGFLQDDKIWLEIMASRNSSAHIYSADIAKEIISDINGKYCQAFLSLLNLYNNNNL